MDRKPKYVVMLSIGEIQSLCCPLLHSFPAIAPQNPDVLSNAGRIS